MNRLYQAWYYLSILGLFYAGFVYISSSSCFGEISERCRGTSLGYVLLVISLTVIDFFLAYRMYKYGSLTTPKPSLRFSWRGDRSFPVSFIAFFIFGAVFLGEHLPVIIGFLGNHWSQPDAKPSPFDLGGLGDAGVVYVIYAVFGTMLWLLFRFFSWPVILLIGAAVGGVAEVFLFLNEQNPAEDTVSIGFIIGSIIIWGGMISVIPQTIYQNISRRWESRGRTIAIGVVITLNLVSLGFFAYQKYVLKQVNYSRTGWPAGICPDRVVDKVGQPSIAYSQGQTFTRLGKGAHEWIGANCPGVIERIE